jgi:hypothetical protein
MKLLKSVLLVTLLSSSALPACGMVKVAGLGGGKASPATSAAANDGAASAAAPTVAGAADGGVASRLTFADVSDGDDANAVFKRMGADKALPQRGANPDPTWIPGFAGLSLTDEAKTAVAQAAINRTWTKRAEADFTAWWTAHDPIARAQAADLAKIGADDAATLYTRAAALRIAWARTKAAASAAKLDPTLLAYQLAAAAAELHTRAGVPSLTDGFLRSLELDRTSLAKAGRPMADKAAEHDRFIVAAMAGDLTATVGTPALPRLVEYGKAFAAVRWPLDAAGTEGAREGVAAARTQAQAQLAGAADLPSLDHGAAAGSMVILVGEGDDRKSGDFRSDRIVAKVAGVSVTLTGRNGRSVPYACKKLLQHDAAGVPSIINDCKYKQEDTSVSITLVTSALPDGVALQPGDVIDALATMGPTQRGKGTLAVELSGAVLTRVVRDGQVVFAY